MPLEDVHLEFPLDEHEEKHAAEREVEERLADMQANEEKLINHYVLDAAGRRVLLIRRFCSGSLASSRASNCFPGPHERFPLEAYLLLYEEGEQVL